MNNALDKMSVRVRRDRLRELEQQNEDLKVGIGIVKFHLDKVSGYENALRFQTAKQELQDLSDAYL